MWHRGLILPSHVKRRCDELVTRAQRATDVAAVFEAASPRLSRIVPLDAAAWMATDPATGLCMAPMRLENLTPRAESIEHEFRADDVNKFRDLARAQIPVGTLLAATGGRPTHSARYRQFHQSDFSDELRAVLRIGDSHWGNVSLLRAHGRSPFSERDVAIMASLSGPLALALRGCARVDPRTWPGSKVGAGLLLFGPAGELVSINDEARHWLAQLPDTGGVGSPGLSGPHEIELPPWLASTVLRARSAAMAGDAAEAWGRVVSPSGRWLVCDASCLRDANGAITGTALVIAPARSADLAPIIVEAYELTDREQQVTQLIARGASTAEIADDLYLSTHTVRHHIKAVFEKLGVSSRGELVAKLFAEHQLPAIASTPAR